VDGSARWSWSISSRASPLLFDCRATSFDPKSCHIIGFGGFSTVSLETRREHGRAAAVKRISPEDSDPDAFSREVNALAALNHPCVIRFLGCSKPDGSNAGEIHTEFAEHGSLAAILTRVNKRSVPAFWTPTGQAILVCGIVLGMRYVHSQRFIHRDLKPSNIFVHGACEASIGDFGASHRETEETPLLADTGTGTAHYSAPEMLEPGAVCTNKVDVFSFGLVLYEILTESAAFPAALGALAVVGKIRNREMPPVRGCGDFMRDLIGRCWSSDAELRPSFDDILREFENKQFDIIPGVNIAKLKDYVRAIRRWESGSD
jgi:serine/threonine protein kinase